MIQAARDAVYLWRRRRCNQYLADLMLARPRTVVPEQRRDCGCPADPVVFGHLCQAPIFDEEEPVW
jgi:hypothetical protein